MSHSTTFDDARRRAEAELKGESADSIAQEEAAFPDPAAGMDTAAAVDGQPLRLASGEIYLDELNRTFERNRQAPAGLDPADAPQIVAAAEASARASARSRTGGAAVIGYYTGYFALGMLAASVGAMLGFYFVGARQSPTPPPGSAAGPSAYALLPPPDRESAGVPEAPPASAPSALAESFVADSVNCGPHAGCEGSVGCGDEGQPVAEGAGEDFSCFSHGNSGSACGGDPDIVVINAKIPGAPKVKADARRRTAARDKLRYSSWQASPYRAGRGSSDDAVAAGTTARDKGAAWIEAQVRRKARSERKAIARAASLADMLSGGKPKASQAGSSDRAARDLQNMLAGGSAPVATGAVKAPSISLGGIAGPPTAAEVTHTLASDEVTRLLKNATRGYGTQASVAPSGLPRDLSASALTSASRGLRSKVKKCFQTFGFSAETVKLKFVVSGTTGKIAGVRVLGRYSDSPAAHCAKRAAKKMRFNRFQMSLQHVTLPIWVD